MTKTRSLWGEILYWIAIILLLTAGGMLLFTDLGEANISDCDEARHGINAYEMLQSGDYVVSTYIGETDYWNLKPPLSFYSIILGYLLFGFNAFGMRFYSALSMLLVMIIMALWSKKRYGSLTSLFCQLFWVGCATVYGPHFARFGDADAQMLLFYVISMLCMLKSTKDLRWLYGSAVCFGLAFMSKSWHAALIPVTCFVFVCATGLIRKLRLRHYLLLIFFGLLPIAPWAIARYQRDGLAFFTQAFTVDVATRASTVHEGHKGDVFYYIVHLWANPATAMAIVTVALALVCRLLRRTKLSTDQIGIAVWFLTPLVLYSACVSKLAWYIFVSLPALAIALGWAMQKLCCPGKARVLRSAVAVACCCVLLFMGWGNWQTVTASANLDRYQTMILDYFDREVDSGTKIYVQYETVNSYYPTDYRSWVQDDRLFCQLYGDLQCMNGGIEAFLEEEDHAYLICHDIGMDWDLLIDYPIVSEDGPLMMLENFN